MSDGRTADLRLCEGLIRHHIEVKDKLESDQRASGREAVLSSGKIHEQMDSLSYSNRIRGVFRDAHATTKGDSSDC